MKKLFFLTLNTFFREVYSIIATDTIQILKPNTLNLFNNAPPDTKKLLIKKIEESLDDNKQSVLFINNKKIIIEP